jgi:hypothetical protein
MTGPGASAEYPRSDLYISFRREGKWTPARNLGAPVNSDAEESSPFVSRDGKTFYFVSEKNFITIPAKPRLTYGALEQGLHDIGNGLGDIYQLPADMLWTPAPYTHKDSLKEAMLFAPGIISTSDDEFGGTFSPDGKTCWFSKSMLRFYLDVICYSEFRDGKWQTPRVAPFSGSYRDFDPVLSPDGKKMVFTSNRPVEGKLKQDYDIWMVEKKDDGALGGEGDADFYYSKLVDGPYSTAVHLTDSVSTAAYELDCLIAPDESFLLMGAYGRQDGYGNYDQ